jgi:hypothetical protein
MTSTYLRKEAENYFIYVLGKNGEVRSGQTVKVMCTHRDG